MSKRNGTVEAPVCAPTRLDLACGQSKREGFFGVDIAETDDADLTYDLLRFPWPFEDDSVEEVHCSHFVEHIPNWRPWFPNDTDGLVLFLNEIYRVCVDGAKVEIIHPYAQSKRAFQDPTHTRYINEITWWYFNREWREMQKLDHYPIDCDFAVEGVANGWYPGWELRSEVARQFQSEHSWNVVTDLAVSLKAIKA